MENLRGKGWGKGLVSKAIKSFRNQFLKKLKQAENKPENAKLKYSVKDTEAGFRIEITGPKELVLRERGILRKDYDEIVGKKKGERGLTMLTAIGISFLFWLEEEGKVKSDKEIFEETARGK